LNLIAALNSLNQPWVAIIVILLGMTFDIICQHFGVSNDAATGVIGAGVGLLTGQALNRATTVLTDPAATSKTTVETTSVPAPPKES
jgi:hypothetical protein